MVNYKVHGLILDLVFINDAPDKERDALTHFILGMANTEYLWATHSDAGKVYVLNGSDISDAERTLLRVVARLSFSTAEGITIAQQLRRLEVANQHYQDKVEYPVLRPKRDFRVWSDLEFYNQYGGFDNDGRDYVVTNTDTPMPWINVIANEQHFGCIVSSTMAGFTFAHNAQQFKLTGWSNDMVRDNASEMLLINRRQFLPATARHSQGWSAFDAEYDDGLAVKVRTFVSVDKPEKYYQIKVKNGSAESRQVQVEMVYKLVLGMCEEETARYLHSEWDEGANSLVVRNVYHAVYDDERLRLSCTERLTEVSMQYPNRKRVGLVLRLAPGEERELAFIIASYRVTGSQGDRVENGGWRTENNAATRPLSQPAGWGVEAGTPQSCGQLPLARGAASLETIYAEFERVVAYWDERLSHIEVETPDRALNHMLNRWYLYEVYASRLFARAGFYQVGGATGFRDQLQDVMSLLYSDPGYARRQILDHAAHEFPEGDVLHWWHESLHFGARTTFSDDYLWLVFVTHQYVRVTGDEGILSEGVPFCRAEPLAPGEAERGMHYTVGNEKSTLYDHLRRGVDRALSRMGRHGLPLMGCGDWNDGMSAVGVGGKGESVWVAFFLCDLLPKMEELTVLAGKMPALQADLAYCEQLHDARQRLVDALQKNTWDGSWFLRAFFDNGDPMGSRNNIECQIDLITQAWSILTDVASPEQKRSVLRETDRRLVNREQEIIQLLTPAFKESSPSPGYIMNYPVGLRENGGQYTHGAMWYIMAKLKEGQRDEAYYLYSIINPVHRTQTLADVLKYKVEPYCIAADIYSNPQHAGRGGWTWYTGSASWAYKTGIENILGLHKQGDTLVLDPRVPTEWPSFTLRYRFGQSMYIIRYTRPNTTQPLSHTDAQPLNHSITLVDDGKEHEIAIGR